MSTQAPYTQTSKFAAISYPDLNPTDFIIHAFMLDDYKFFNKEKKHYSPDQEWIAFSLGVNRATVMRSLKKLYKAGLVVKVESNQKTNTYIVNEAKSLNYEEARNSFMLQKVTSNTVSCCKLSHVDVAKCNTYQPNYQPTNNNLNIEEDNKEVVEVKMNQNDSTRNEYESAPSTVSIESEEVNDESFSTVSPLTSVSSLNCRGSSQDYKSYVLSDEVEQRIRNAVDTIQSKGVRTGTNPYPSADAVGF